MRPSLSFPSYKKGTSRLLCLSGHFLYAEYILSVRYPQLRGTQNSHGETESQKLITLRSEEWFCTSAGRVLTPPPPGGVQSHRQASSQNNDPQKGFPKELFSWFSAVIKVKFKPLALAFWLFLGWVAPAPQALIFSSQKGDSNIFTLRGVGVDCIDSTCNIECLAHSKSQ